MKIEKGCVLEIAGGSGRELLACCEFRKFKQILANCGVSCPKKLGMNAGRLVRGKVGYA